MEFYLIMCPTIAGGKEYRRPTTRVLGVLFGQHAQNKCRMRRACLCTCVCVCARRVCELRGMLPCKERMVCGG